MDDRPNRRNFSGVEWTLPLGVKSHSVNALAGQGGYHTHSLPKASFVLFSLSTTSGSVPPVSKSPAALSRVTIFIFLALELKRLNSARYHEPIIVFVSL